VGQSIAFKTTAKTAAQAVAQKQNVFSQADVEKLLDDTLGLINDVRKKVGEEAQRVTMERARDQAHIQERITSLDQLLGPIESQARQDNEVLTRMAAAAERGDTDEVARLRGEAMQRARQTALSGERIRYQRLMDGIQDIYERTVAMDAQNGAAIGALPVAEAIRTAARQRLANRDDAQTLNGAARVSDVAEFKQRLIADVPTPEHIARLLDDADPARLRQNMLKEGLDIVAIRKGLDAGLTRAKKRGDRATQTRLEDLAVEIDDVRIKLVNEGLAEFFDKNPQYASQVVAVVQGGAARGNPEYQGIFADIDFTILTRPGARDAEIKQALEAFFADKGHPLATRASGGYSPMDTEAFAQPAANFNSSEETRPTILTDLAIKMGDATRFYSEGGGKWFINNMNYSGKPLWGKLPEGDGWVHMTRGEAHGLAIDMTRYMDFLTDPKYHHTNIARLSGDRQKAVLTSVLKKTKYFIRLVDAYIISHARGNRYYNEERIKAKRSQGEDASYHWQIAKETERLMRAGATVFDDGDLEVVRWMAQMKMKGDNPTPFDVLGDDDAGVAKGLRMVERMHDLAPKLLAATAQVYDEEVAATVQGGSADERQAAYADAHRKASTVRKVLETDSFGALALMTPKAVRDGDRTHILDEAAHAEAIRRRMDMYRRLREDLKQVEDDEEAAIGAQPVEDVQGLQTKLKFTRTARELYGGEAFVGRITRASLNVNEENEFTGWLQYQWLLADNLIGAGARPQ